MLNISAQEILVVLVLALIVVGPQRLPEIARSIGKGMREFRKMQDEVKDMVKVDLNPEPPTVHQAGVSGPKPQPRPHRTPRPAAAPADDVAATLTDEAAGDAGSMLSNGGPHVPADADTPHADADTPAAATAPDGDDPDGPPAAAGAG
jgi:sec-independent protein translocase protein TatB